MTSSEQYYNAMYQLSSERHRLIKSKNRLILQCLSFVVSHLNEYNKPVTLLPENIRKQLFKDGKKIIKQIIEKDPPGKNQLHVYSACLETVTTYKEAESVFMNRINTLEKTMEPIIKKWLKTMPHTKEFLEKPDGFSYISLAGLVAHAGPLDGYSNPAKIWKRMGLAVIDGKIQKLHAKKGITQKEAMIIGYNRERRAAMHVIGQNLLRAKGKYHRIYKNRRRYEETKIKLKAHLHNRSLRYIEKILLYDLWIVWMLDTNPDAVDIGLAELDRYTQQSIERLNAIAAE